ncbi:MAG TPA: membrane dipeptidase [Polyangiaceae bacterium]|nr:membrane dipeptidase [Polyangiaceae bacterium]
MHVFRCLLPWLAALLVGCSSSPTTSSIPDDPAAGDAGDAGDVSHPDAIATDASGEAADGASDAAEPIEASEPGPVPGFADIHVHHLAEYAYAGAWFHGSHKGEEAVAMGACSGGDVLGGDHARTSLSVLNEFLAQAPGTSGDTGWHFNKTHGYPEYDGWPRWDTIAHQQVWEGHLRAAHDRGLNLMLMSAVNFKPLCEIMPEANRDPGRTCDDMEAVDVQLDAAWEFDQARDWVEIALSPQDARRIIGEGKLAMVLAIEVSDLFPEGDWLAQLKAYHERGVRSIQLVHQLDNRFCGAAPHHWIFKVFQLLDRDTGFDLDDEGKNTKGLTVEGEALLHAMMDMGMIIDISHVSERGVKRSYELASSRDFYPLVLSHGHFRSIMLDDKQTEEKTTPDWAVKMIRETGGMFGLRTGAEQVKTYSKSGVANDCDGSTRSLAQAFAYGTKGLKVPIALASDFNGYIAQLRPRFGGEKETCGASGDSKRIAAQQAVQASPSGTLLDTAGFGHIGIEPDVIAELKSFGLDTSPLESSAETFLRVWERGLDPDRKGPHPADDLDTSGIEP